MPPVCSSTSNGAIVPANGTANYRLNHGRGGPGLFAGWAVTFLFVMLGWVWFLLPTPQLALQTYAALFGLHNIKSGFRLFVAGIQVRY
jgi:D-alanyl-lipoteichoic acid acyltransferase DltB (MBOAT superfamily)